MEKKINNPMGNIRQKQKAETYALILNTAGDMFETMGYEKTTMRKIAAKVGISPGAIFKHFDNKSSLLAAKLYEDLEIVQEKGLDTIPKKATIENQFLHIAECFFKYYDLRPVLSKILVQHSILIEGIWAEKFESQRRDMGETFVQLIEEGKKRNEIKKDVDSFTLLMTLWSNYIWALILFVNNPAINATIAIEMLKPLVKQSCSGAIKK